MIVKIRPVMPQTLQMTKVGVRRAGMYTLSPYVHMISTCIHNIHMHIHNIHMCLKAWKDRGEHLKC